MEQKVTKFGNSLGITMTDVLKQIGLDQGDTVRIEVSPATGEIIIKKSTKVSLPEGISADFMNTLMMSLKNTIKRFEDLRTDDIHPLFIRPT